MKRSYTAITCKRAKRFLGSAPRPYGYTIAVTPPEKILVLGEDVEGIGWVDYQLPKTITVHWQGWYKHKSDAQSRAAELNKS